MQLVQKMNVHWDFPSLLYILLNYAVSILSLHTFFFTISISLFTLSFALVTLKIHTVIQFQVLSHRL